MNVLGCELAGCISARMLFVHAVREELRTTHYCRLGLASMREAQSPVATSTLNSTPPNGCCRCIDPWYLSVAALACSVAAQRQCSRPLRFEKGVIHGEVRDSFQSGR